MNEKTVAMNRIIFLVLICSLGYFLYFGQRNQENKYEYKKPLTAMRNHLEAMETAVYLGANPKEDAPIVTFNGLDARKHDLLRRATLHALSR